MSVGAGTGWCVGRGSGALVGTVVGTGMGADVGKVEFNHRFGWS